VIYSCKSEAGEKIFENKVEPYIFKPDKQSQTASEGGNAEFKCALLFGNEEGNDNVKWSWKKNDTELEPSDRIKIIGQTGNETTLQLSKVTQNDKGGYSCVATNSYGSHSEEIKLRVKDAYAALWPFLAIIAEVLALCTIILIYEKKCAKKNANEDENEQAQNL
jgi:hypothetical protein